MLTQKIRFLSYSGNLLTACGSLLWISRNILCYALHIISSQVFAPSVDHGLEFVRLEAGHTSETDMNTTF